MSPEEQKKAQLLEDLDFAKIVKSMKMRAPIQQIVTKVKAEGRYSIEDVLLFASEGEKATVQKMGMGAGAAAEAKPKSAAEAAAEKKER